MRSPKNISVIDYTYHLPENRIAKFPISPKHNSRLLIYKKGVISETIFKSVAQETEQDSLLVLNNTKVLQARIIFEKETGGKIEIFCLQPAHGELWHNILSNKKNCELECLVGGINKWKSGPLKKNITIGTRTLNLNASYLADLPNAKLIKLSWDDDSKSLMEVMEFAGETPLPPYLQRKPEKRDKLFYQTCYALHEGSVAAPTAGLHFTEDLFSRFDEKNIRKLFVTLHVGAGTFKPIKSEKLAQHEMHKEWMCIKQTQLKQLLENKTNIIPVGTTSLRFLESLYWFGVALIQDKSIELSQLELKQWDVYEQRVPVSKTEALGALLTKMAFEKKETFYTNTQILIAPGYEFKIADALITNFHQPGSTLLLLIAAAVGEDWKMIYNYALENDFRFLSYGDSSLLWINKQKARDH